MKQISVRILILLFAFFARGYAEEKAVYEIIEDKSTLNILTPDLSNRQTLKLRLPNGLEAYLISDQKADKSAAALSVNVGAWHDPKEYPGLAHFLEHMLFLGTKKYPNEAEYMQFITSHGGKANAYTASTQTSYLFSIGNLAFVEALDRFSQFFKEPLFDSSCVDREMQAISQEHAKNLDSDERRLLYVLKELAVEDHPFHNFQAGTADTLANATQDILKNWYKEHYSANQMRLVVHSNLPINELAKIVANDFHDVPNYNLELEFPTACMYSEKLLGKIVHVEPVKDIREMSVIWEIPQSIVAMRESQPERIVCRFLGHEGAGSLIDVLKREMLADSISADVVKLGPNNWLLFVNIGLTQQGVKKSNLVMERTFQAIAKYKESDIPKYLFDEEKKMAELNYSFQPRSDSFTQMMKHTTIIFEEPLSSYPQKAITIEKFDPMAVRNLLHAMTPEKAQFYLMAPHALTSVVCDKKEKWTGASYAIKELEHDQLEKCQGAGCHIEMNLPAPNPFIPQNLAIADFNDRMKEPAEIIPHPEAILRDDKGMIFFAEDQLYHMPQVDLFFEFKTPSIEMGNTAKIVMADLYIKSVQEALRDVSYNAQLAGINYSIQRENFGLSLNIFGYKEKSENLLKEILGKLKSIHPLESEFSTYKEELQSNYLNAEKLSPIVQASEMLKRIMFKKFVTEKQKAAAIRKISYEQFNDFIGELFRKTYTEGVIYGALDRQEATSIASNVMKGIAGDQYPQGRFKVPYVIVLPKDKGPFYIEEKTKAQGNATLLAIENPSYSFKAQGAQQILMQAIQVPFYSDLRTKQQTGYIVTSYPIEIERQLFNIFGVQSSTHDARDLLARFELFIETYLQDFDQKITEQQFDAIRQTIVHELEQPPKDMKMMGNVLKSLAFNFEDFDWISKRILALKELKYEELIDMANNFLDRQNKRRVAVLMDGVTPYEDELHYVEVKNISEIRRESVYTDGTDMEDAGYTL